MKPSYLYIITASPRAGGKERRVLYTCLDPSYAEFSAALKDLRVPYTFGQVAESILLERQRSLHLELPDLKGYACRSELYWEVSLSVISLPPSG